MPYLLNLRRAVMTLPDARRALGRRIDVLTEGLPPAERAAARRRLGQQVDGIQERGGARIGPIPPDTLYVGVQHVTWISLWLLVAPDVPFCDLTREQLIGLYNDQKRVPA